MRASFIVGSALLLVSCFSAANFDPCVGPSQCGAHLNPGNEDRFYMCLEGECIDPQAHYGPVVDWRPGLGADQVVRINGAVDLGTEGLVAGQPLILRHRGIVIEKDALLNATGAGHPGGGGGGGGAGVPQGGGNEDLRAGRGGSVDGANAGASGDGTDGGDGGQGGGLRGGAGGAGDRQDPFIGEACGEAGNGGEGQSGRYDLGAETSFNPCAPIDLMRPPMGGGGGGGGGGRGATASEMALGGGGGSAGGAGGGAVILIATEFIEIRGEIRSNGAVGGSAPECAVCLDGDGGDGADNASAVAAQAGARPCLGARGGAGGGGLVYLEAPKILIGRNAKIDVSGGANDRESGGHVILIGEIESRPGQPLPVEGFAHYCQ